MAFNAASVDAVADACMRMRAVRQIIVQNQLTIGENEDALLTVPERDAIRTRLQGVIVNLKNAVQAEVGTW